MKRFVIKFVSVIIIGILGMLTACSSDDVVEIVDENTVESHWQRAYVNLHVNRTKFDELAGVTRSVDEGWKDGDRIYLILKDNDGNNVQAYVEYEESSETWGQVEYDGYRSQLTCTTPRTVEAYFFDGEKNTTTSDITFEYTTGVYVCKDGLYTYPADGDLEVNISLEPLTSRIRFIGESGTNFTILNGLKTYNVFSRTTGMLTSSSASIRTAVDTTGTSPYIYGVFSNTDEPSLEVLNNKDRFKTIFETSTNVLKVGHSGYMNIPTEDSHRGWKQVFIKATNINIDKTSLNLLVGVIDTLNVALIPVDATSKIVWSSSDTSVVDVSEAGVVTAIAVGSAVITATVEDNPNIKVTCSIEVRTRGTITYPDWTSTNKAHGSTSSYTYNITTIPDDIITFNWKVSSEASYDYLTVTLDGSEILKKSGVLSGSYQHKCTKSTTHKLVVKYTKDGSNSSGGDYASIYNVCLN